MPQHVTVIIPALNEERYIETCLTSIKGLAPDGPTADVVLADNGSTDRTVEIARRLGAQAVINPKVTIGGLRNHGALLATGEVLAFLDADCTVPPDWLSAALATMAQQSAHIVGSVHRAPDNSGWIATAAAELSASKTGLVNYIPSGNLIVSKACFDSLGGFDERMRTNEDVEFCQRARRAGFKVYSDPAIVAIHHGVPGSGLDFFRRELWHGRDSFLVFVEDLRRVTNLKVVVASLAFAFVGLSGVFAALAAAILRSLVPIGLFGLLLAALVGAVWVVRVRPYRRHRLSILWHQLVYGTARATSLLVAVASLLSGRKTSRGSWRVTSEPSEKSGAASDASSL